MRRLASPERLALAATMCAGVALLMFAARDSSFFRDDWYFVQYRDGRDLENYLAPHGGHLYVLPVALYRLLFGTAGLDGYEFFVLVHVLAVALLVGLVFFLVRQRLGTAPAVVGASLLFTLGPGWQVLLWPFEIGFALALAAGLSAILALERNDRKGDLAAAAALLVALACGGVGLAVLAGIATQVLLGPDRWRRVWVPAMAALLYSAWYAWLGAAEDPLEWTNLAIAPSYVLDASAGALGSLVGLGRGAGLLLTVGLVALIIRRLLVPGALPLRLIAIGVMALSFWGLAALARGRFEDPTANRYLLVGAVLCVLLLAETLPRGVVLRGRPAVLSGVAMLVVLVANTAALLEGGSTLRKAASISRAEVTGLELMGGAADPDFVIPGLSRTQTAVRAAPYREAIARWHSSPADSEARLLRRSEALRRQADAAATGSLARAISARRGARRILVDLDGERVAGGRLRREGRCIVLTPARPGASLDLKYPPGGLGVSASAAAQARVFARRFAHGFGRQPLGPGNVGEELSAVRLPRGRSRLPWHIRVTAIAEVRVCALAVRRAR